MRIVETMGNKFAVGQVGHKGMKYVEAQSGTNLYFAIYQAADGQRSYETIPLNIVVERLKQGLGPVPEKNDKDEPLKFYLSPNDLVYVPTEEEEQDHVITLHQDHIYKMVSSTGSQCMFVYHRVANSIVNKVEFSALNKMERSIDNRKVMIKAVCWKIEVDRLGNIINVIK